MKVRLENKSLQENFKQITLDHNETWGERITLTPTFEGNNMKLEFLLYNETDTNVPYRDLHLWINVSEAE